jgi:hypothetical protein
LAVLGVGALILCDQVFIEFGELFVRDLLAFEDERWAFQSLPHHEQPDGDQSD